MIIPIKYCRNCEGKLNPVIEFGKMPIANGFLNKNEIAKEVFFNLTSMYCTSCSLFQLLENPSPEQMFHENYAYYSGQSSFMQDHFKKLANFIEKNDDTNKKILEIGNNDGGVIEYLNDKNICVGVEPSKNVADVSIRKGLQVENNYFNLNTAENLLAKYEKFDYIISLNVLAHIPDINSVFSGISKLLKNDGVYITEDPYLLDMFDQCSYDQVYDEHIFIFSLLSISKIISKFDLEIFNIEKVNTAGGSMRYFIGKKNQHKIHNNVTNQISEEMRVNLLSEKPYKQFNQDCQNSKKSLLKKIDSYLLQKKTICSYGATSKSTTIFNFCNIDENRIKFITDTTPIKQNKLSPGMHIPIYDHDFFNRNKPDVIFLAAWNLKKEIFNKEKNNFSGKWISHIDDFI